MIQAAKLASAKRITAVVPLVPVLAPGSQGEAARADLGAPRRRHAPARRRRPGADDGPARRPDPGVLHDPGRPHDRAAAVRAPLPRSRARPATTSSRSLPTPAARSRRSRFAEMIEADFAVMHKTRPAHDSVAVTEITGRVRDKIAIVGDDVIMTGGTLLAERRGAEGAGRDGRLGVRDARPLLRRRARALRRRRDRRHRRHRHGADRPAEQAGQPDACCRSPGCSPRRS